MALSATVQWDVRTTGNDTNGGGFDPSVSSPGTDYSQQDSAQVVFTDLVIGATTTNLTSSANAFTSSHIGNIINITGGTGFTVGRYTVESVSGAVATLDRSVGTAASTGGTGALGGAFATISAANTACVAGNTVNIKSGTYTLTSTITFAVATATWTGYAVAHGDNGTKPLITTATNNTVLINTGSSTNGIQTFNNLSLSNTASTRQSGIWQQNAHGSQQWWLFSNCVFDGFTIAIENTDNVPYYVDFVVANNCEIKNCTGSGYSNSDGNNTWTSFSGCYFHGNATHVVANGTSLFFRCIFGPGNVGIDCGPFLTTIEHCTFYGLTSQGIFPSLTQPSLSIMNSLFYGNAYAISASGPSASLTNSNSSSRNNAFGGNTNPNFFWPLTGFDVTLTADPFTNSSGGDFSLNSTVGGGTACKGAGFSQSFTGASFTSSPDIGAVQSSGGGGGGAATTVSYAFA